MYDNKKECKYRSFWKKTVMVFTIFLLSSCTSNNKVQNSLTASSNTSTTIPIVTPTFTEVLKTAVPTSTIDPNLYPIQILPGTTKNSISWSIRADNYSWPPTMSSDHKWIAFSIGRKSSLSDDSTYRENVWIFSPADSKGFFLFDEDDDFGGYSFPIPHFSIDGKYLSVATDKIIQIYKTSNWQKMNEYSCDRNMSQINWSPTNDSFLVPNNTYTNPVTGITTPEEKKASILWLQKLDGTRLQLLTVADIYPNGLPVAEIYSWYAWGPTWSPSGDKIAFVKYFIDPQSTNKSERSELWVLDLDSGEKTKLSDGGFLHDPVWSPDGNKIAIENLDYKNLRNEIQIYDWQTKLTNNYFGDIGNFEIFYDLVWSPSSQKIAVSLKTNNKKNLYLINVNTGEFSSIKTGDIFPVIWTKDNFLFSYEWMGNYNGMELMNLNE